MTPFFHLSIRLTLLFLLSLILRPFSGQAQETSQLYGKLVVEDSSPLPFANVVLIRGYRLITGVVSDNDGSFSLPIQETGTYQLRISAIGYNDYSMPAIEAGSTAVLQEGYPNYNSAHIAAQSHSLQ